jgi:hypothetical protein
MRFFFVEKSQAKRLAVAKQSLVMQESLPVEAQRTTSDFQLI